MIFRLTLNTSLKYTASRKQVVLGKTGRKRDLILTKAKYVEEQINGQNSAHGRRNPDERILGHTPAPLLQLRSCREGSTDCVRLSLSPSQTRQRGRPDGTLRA